MRQEIAEQMRLNSEPAMLVIRPYPPVDLPATGSQLGGLPLLRPQDDWPCACDGTPLHFLARIDCSELPNIGHWLPSAGFLQFFARLDDEMIWDGDVQDFARVIYSDPAGSIETQPPDNLPAIEGGFFDYDREMRLPDEPLTKVYPSWSLVFEKIISWPQDPKIGVASPTDFDTPYRVAVGRARAAEIVCTTGLPTNPYLKPYWGLHGFSRDGRPAIRLPFRSGLGRRDIKFPEAWIIIDRISRAAVWAMTRALTNMDRKREADEISAARREVLQRIIPEARGWIERAKVEGLDKPVPVSDADTFGDWIIGWPIADDHEIANLTVAALNSGMSYAIQYCGSSRGASELISPGYMNALEHEHLPTASENQSIQVAPPIREIVTRHHQMLGHATSSQDVRATADTLLLQLVSDRGVGFSFCDLGEIRFRINSEYLEAKRFDRIEVFTQGV